MWDALPEPVREFLAWYLAPWRRIGRAPFNLIFGIVTVLPLVFSLAGLAESAGPMLGGLQSIQQAAQGNASAVPQVEALLRGSAGGAPAAWAFPWGAVFNLALLVGLVPLVRMRARDVGWAAPWQQHVVVGVLILPALGPVLAALGLALPGGMLFTVMGFIVLGILCVKGSAPAPERVRTPYDTPPPHDPLPPA